MVQRFDEAFTVWIESNYYETLEALAEHNEQGVSALARKYIKDGLEEDVQHIPDDQIELFEEGEKDGN
jgi:hypothetical protein